ncbi:hypothetical protein [Roseovarius salis]|uniref:hypothetical protein n=1 Tax=Roseovarius salis TaxID=3376063 RepID=UPI0037CA1E24
MLVTIICIYMAVWGCAYAAARRFKSRAAFWVLYVVAVLPVPAFFTGAFYVVYAGVDAENAAQLAATVLVLGMALAVLSYPLSHARLRRNGGA